jgi:ATPase subunit of ABC transporter with duplicated ATPase domains
MSSIVTASGVSLELPSGRVLFKNLNFSIQSKLTALVGPNGVGKTCLANLLVGTIEPTTGTIRRHTSITFFPQRQLPDAITVDEFIAFDYIWSALGEKLIGDIDRQTLCTHLSGGQWMRVRLAKSIGDQFLILDEPTNDLDREGRQALLQFLRERDGGALVISHDRECLQLCEDIFELSNHGLSKFGDGWELYEHTKQSERTNLSHVLEKARSDRDEAHQVRISKKLKQEKRNQRGTEVASRGGIPKILLGARKRKAQVTTGQIDVTTSEHAEQKVRDAYQAFAELKKDPIMYADLSGKKIPAQKLVAEADHFNIKFQNWLYPADLIFTWRGNIRVALKGSNGSGKSTLLKFILDQTSETKYETRGELRCGNLATLYVDQRCAILDEEKSIFKNIQDTANLDESEIRNGLARFLFPKETVFQSVKSLSGGERLRAAMAKGLLSAQKPELLILDEPTNNLDLPNIAFLENLVKEFQGAVIVISHDEVFNKNANITDEFFISK